MAKPLSPAKWAEKYQTAIEGILTGQLSSYTLAGRTFTKHDLKTLEDLHRYWLGRAQEADTGFVTYADTTGEGYEGTSGGMT